jgi:hypothetical protein
MRPEAGCATQRATVGVGDVPSVSGVAISTSHGTGRDRDQSGRRRRRRVGSCHKPKLPAAKRGGRERDYCVCGLRVGRRGVAGGAIRGHPGPLLHSRTRPRARSRGAQTVRRKSGRKLHRFRPAVRAPRSGARSVIASILESPRGRPAPGMSWRDRSSGSAPYRSRDDTVSGWSSRRR